VRLGSKGTWKPEQLVIYFYVAYKWEGEPIECVNQGAVYRKPAGPTASRLTRAGQMRWTPAGSLSRRSRTTAWCVGDTRYTDNSTPSRRSTCPKSSVRVPRRRRLWPGSSVMRLIIWDGGWVGCRASEAQVVILSSGCVERPAGQGVLAGSHLRYGGCGCDAVVHIFCAYSHSSLAHSHQRFRTTWAACLRMTFSIPTTLDRLDKGTPPNCGPGSHRTTTTITYNHYKISTRTYLENRLGNWKLRLGVSSLGESSRNVLEC